MPGDPWVGTGLTSQSPPRSVRGRPGASKWDASQPGPPLTVMVLWGELVGKVKGNVGFGGGKGAGGVAGTWGLVLQNGGWKPRGCPHCGVGYFKGRGDRYPYYGERSSLQNRVDWGATGKPFRIAIGSGEEG